MNTLLFREDYRTRKFFGWNYCLREQFLLPYRRRLVSLQFEDNGEMIVKLQFCNIYDCVST